MTNTALSPQPEEPKNDPLVRVATIVEYDGSRYQGLQIQVSGDTIQSAFHKMALQFGVEDCVFRASGRTDTGVHARGQVIALSIPESVTRRNAADAMNWHLPKDIRIRRAVRCRADFDPRHDARLRTYRYLLAAGQSLPPLMRGHMGHAKKRLDFELLQEAARLLRGPWDFRAWRAANCQGKRTEMELDVFNLKRWNDSAAHGMDDGAFEITVASRFFLHHQVRYLVGGLVRVGSRALSLMELQECLENKTRPDRVVPADACGLSLESVYYPPEKDPFLAS
jgi:tRNA pseudouridine38-40 synthase